jgi:hypothetical protein
VKCKAKRHDGEPCQAHAIRHAAVCRVHGGSAKQVRQAAARREAMAGAESAVKRLAAVAEPSTPVVDPLEALAVLAGEVLRWKDLLAAHVADLDGLRYSGISGEQVRGEIMLFGQALDRCNTVLSTYARLGIDERLVRIEEQRADMIAVIIRAVLADRELALTDEQTALAPAVVVRHLQAVTA